MNLINKRLAQQHRKFSNGISIFQQQLQLHYHLRPFAFISFWQIDFHVTVDMRRKGQELGEENDEAAKCWIQQSVFDELSMNCLSTLCCIDVFVSLCQINNVLINLSYIFDVIKSCCDIMKRIAKLNYARCIPQNIRACNI